MIAPEVIAELVLIFAAGAAVGILVDRFFVRRKHEAEASVPAKIGEQLTELQIGSDTARRHLAEARHEAIHRETQHQQEMEQMASSQADLEETTERIDETTQRIEKKSADSMAPFRTPDSDRDEQGA